MRFSFSILINANLCSLSTQKQSHCFSITIMACIFHGGNTFHKPCQAIDFSIWYVLFWLVRGTLHKQFGHRIPSSGWCRPWKCFDISRSVICFLWSFHLKRRWSLRNLISRLFPVLVFNFSFNICWKPRHMSQYILFSLEAIQCSEQIRWKHHRPRRRINNTINNFLKPLFKNQNAFPCQRQKSYQA